MKKIFLALISCIVIGCASDTPQKAIVVPQMAPKIERIAQQSTITRNAADQTLALASQAKTKYTQDKLIADVETSARQTAEHAKDTEIQLHSVKEYARDADKRANNMADQLDRKEGEINKLNILINELKNKINIRNAYIFTLILICCGLICFILKPWKWFI